MINYQKSDKSWNTNAATQIWEHKSQFFVFSNKIFFDKWKTKNEDKHWALSPEKFAASIYKIGSVQSWYIYLWWMGVLLFLLSNYVMFLLGKTPSFHLLLFSLILPPGPPSTPCLNLCVRDPAGNIEGSNLVIEHLFNQSKRLARV